LNRLRALFSNGALALGQAGLVALVVVVLVAGTALAAKGGNGNGHAGKNTGGSGSLALAMAYDQNADGAPNWDDKVTFNVSTTSTDKPWVNLNCYQNGAWVYTATVGFFPAYPWAQTFTLASTMWAGGAGSCTATLYMVTSNGRQSTLATLGFDVGA
jgi:hypothetical protein